MLRKGVKVNDEWQYSIQDNDYFIRFSVLRSTCKVKSKVKLSHITMTVVGVGRV